MRIPVPLLIKSGRIVTAADDYRADVLCDGGVIAAIGRDLPPPAGGEVIDARGMLVFPGFIDPHVHVHLPFMGTHAKDDWASASRAALVGGTTTLIEMCCPRREDDPERALDLWRSKAEGRASCDYSFHMGVTRFDAHTPAAMRRIVASGVASFKVFLAYRGFFGIDDAELFHTLGLAGDLGVIVTAHCENETLVAELQRRLLARGDTDPQWHEPSRPVRVEAEGVHHLTSFAEQTGAAVYLVHTSCRDAVEAAAAARARGVRVWVEAVIPHLVLDDSYARRPAFEGAKFVMSPPLRSATHRDYLWRALGAGVVSTVATDHAPFDFSGQKEMGRGDFTKIPNGLPGVEDRVRLLYTHGVAAGRIDLHRFVDAASTQAARLFGLAPRKGAIAIGADADLVVYDPTREDTLSAATHQMQVDYNPYEGTRVVGRVAFVTLRGEVMVRDGRFVGPAGKGRFLSRKPGHVRTHAEA